MEHVGEENVAVAAAAAAAELERVDAAAATSLSKLRRAVKAAEPGNGSTRAAIQSANFVISAREFTRLIRSCRNTGQWEKALEILEVVRMGDPKVGAAPNFFTFSAAISVCSKSRRVAETLWLLDEMKAAAKVDSSFQPDTVVYRLVIMCCTREGEHAMALNLFAEMSDGGIEADDQTLEHVLAALIHSMAWERAIQILDKMHARGMVLALDQYNRFIESCSKEGDLSTATEVFLMMQMVGVEPDSNSCCHIMYAIEASGCPVKGADLVEDMHACGIAVQPETYACLLGGCMKTEDNDLLSKVITMMKVQT